MAEEILETQVTWAGDGHLVRGALIHPENTTPNPGIIVSPGAGGMNEGSMEVGRRLARNGYAALIMDPFSSIPESEMPEDHSFPNLLPLFRELDDRSYMISMENGFDFFTSLPMVREDRIGVMGFCASWSILYSCINPRVGACVSFYNNMRYRELARANRAIQPIDRIPGMWCPMIGHYGDNDTATPLEYLEELKEVANRHEKEVEIHIYPDRPHGFVESNDPANLEDAELAWKRTFSFLDRLLKA